MKATFQPGASARFETVVTEDMLASWDGKQAFPVICTGEIVRLMEAASRKLIQAHQDDDHEALGCEISLEHLAPCGAGKTLSATAELVEYRHRRARINVSVFQGERLIATGIHIQRILSKDRVEQIIKAGC